MNNAMRAGGFQIVDNLHAEQSNRKMPQSALNSSSGRQSTATIALLQSSSLPMLVQKELERMILAGDLAAGAKLNEAVVAELLGVSRGPVREAFRRQTLALGGMLPISTREHCDIVEKIASGNAAAAGKALHDHVMASRERMHRTHAGASAKLARRLAVIPARKSR